MITRQEKKTFLGLESKILSVFHDFMSIGNSENTLTAPKKITFKIVFFYLKIFYYIDIYNNHAVWTSVLKVYAVNIFILHAYIYILFSNILYIIEN